MSETQAQYKTSTCRRCDLPLTPESAACPLCGMAKTDPAKEAQIDRRLHDMRRIHDLEMSMTDLQRREWITHGQYIVDRDRGEADWIGLGEK